MLNLNTETDLSTILRGYQIELNNLQDLHHDYEKKRKFKNQVEINKHLNLISEKEELIRDYSNKIAELECDISYLNELDKPINNQHAEGRSGDPTMPDSPKYQTLREIFNEEKHKLGEKNERTAHGLEGASSPVSLSNSHTEVQLKTPLNEIKGKQWNKQTVLAVFQDDSKSAKTLLHKDNKDRSGDRFSYSKNETIDSPTFTLSPYEKSVISGYCSNSRFKSVPSMIKSLVFAEVDCEVLTFSIDNTHQQIRRFIRLAESNTKILSERNKKIVERQFNEFGADTTERREKLLQNLKNYLEFWSADRLEFRGQP